ncbi:MAG: tetraacyldisaccharide 4'-kinase [Candidatus Aminicenantales bacterium]
MDNFLQAFSLPYCLVTSFKNFLYSLKILKTEKAPFPVISVGNIVFGGSGKTPLALHLIDCFLNSGLKPALIFRGYRGGWEKIGGIISDGKTLRGSWKDSGDEPYMAASRFPQAGVFVGKGRLLSSLLAKTLGFDLAVLDDGFQYRELQREVDIVLYDSENSLPWREFPSALQRSDIVLVKKGRELNLKKRLQKYGLSVFSYSVLSVGYQSLRSKEMLPPQAFQGKRGLAFSGIARPHRFFSFLKKEKIDLVSSLAFPDHHPYPEKSVAKIVSNFRQFKPEVVITTEKDAVKLDAGSSRLKTLPLYFLRIELEIEADFYLELSRKLNKAGLKIEALNPRLSSPQIR